LWRPGARDTLAGNCPPTLPAQPVLEIVATREPTVRIFALQSLKWWDATAGRMVLVEKFGDADCPANIADLAYAKGGLIDD
jgi:hypothetical protein